jgi:hypothetical protein
MLFWLWGFFYTVDSLKSRRKLRIAGSGAEGWSEVQLSNLVAQGQGQFRRELTGEGMEPWEIVYFKIHKRKIPLIDRALETAALMLSSDKSRS